MDELSRIWRTSRREKPQVLEKSRITSTEEMKIGGGKDYPLSQDALDQYIDNYVNKGYKKEDILMLFERYGTAIKDILDNEPIDFLNSNPLITKNEIYSLSRREKVVHLDDFLLRRTSFGWLGFIDEASLKEIGDLVGKTLGWDNAKSLRKSIELRSCFKKTMESKI